MVQASAELLAEVAAGSNEDAHWWALRMQEQSEKAYDELVYLLPWLLQPSGTETKGMPTLHELAAMSVVAGDSNIALAVTRAKERLALIDELQRKCNKLADMEYEFLYDRSKHLLSIGYNVEEHRRDNGSYDLLASEARLCNFVAIAQGKLPQESWFALGRLLTNASGAPILLSWSGSMFEYLMPNLVMPEYENTLLYQTNKAVVARQVEYGLQRGVPWGISESGYNMVDANLNYQYRAFGVPGLGLKRGLSEDLVIAPYASMMSLMISPYEACVNMVRLSEEGYEGRY